ncbi:MAG: 2-C-methyl-D-erythritol 2,4-cyclodiphosphate synthase [Clostridia bacterium]|nr:2-C-methyl-D-erythritol 2,4-cyclodiphosphate synthase [Clostridia bacterium]
MRIGHGYDAHRFGGNRPFVIGGVRIPFEKMLKAHSDGDTLAHAVIDALFGAAGLPDIGAQYPDSAAAFDGADSMELLRDAMAKVRAAGFRLEYLDCTVVAQAPKMARHIPEMRRRIAEACEVEPSRVNVKATTEEHMGFTGDGTGIAAHAVCLLLE